MTCLTRGSISSSCRRNPSNTSCFNKLFGRFTPGHLHREAVCCPTTPAGCVQQAAIVLGQLILTHRASGSPPDLQKSQFHASCLIAQPGAGRSGHGCDLLHDAGQHPNAVARLGAVAWVMDISLNHRCIHTRIRRPLVTRLLSFAILIMCR
jgi:hypothetical protein